jgi:hypothetical protein
MLNGGQAAGLPPPSFASTTEGSSSGSPRNGALTWIEKACDDRDLNLVWNFTDPILDPLRGTPRFKAVKKKLGL